MDSKKGIEKVMPVNAWAVGLLDPSFLQSKMDDTAMANPPKEQVGSPVGSTTSPDETPRRESYCLFVRVLRGSDVILEQDCKVSSIVGMPTLAKTFVRPKQECSQAHSL